VQVPSGGRHGEEDDGSEVTRQGVVRQLREAHDVLHVREVRQDDLPDLVSAPDELAHDSEGIREITGLAAPSVSAGLRAHWRKPPLSRRETSPKAARLLANGAEQWPLLPRVHAFRGVPDA
jgi:hypothetical protein